MTLDDRALTDALHAEAGSAVATPEKWEAVMAGSRVARRRRVAQRVAVAGLSAAALIVAGVVLWMWGPSEDRRDLIDQPSGAGPAYIVVAEDGGVVVRDARNGKILRMIVETGQQVGDVSVTPDGSEVYFTRVFDGPCPSGGESVTRLQIAKVPIIGGEQEVVVPDGHRPSVSPSGDYLVYASGPCAGGEHHLYRRTLGVADSDTTISSSSADGEALFPIDWSKDESVLLTEGSPPQSRQRELFTIEGLPNDPRTTKVAYPNEGLEGPGVILGPRSLAGAVEFEGETWVAAFDPKTGEITERLFAVPKRPEYLHVDASGQHFLAGVEAPRGYTLYRWSAGDEAPTELEDVMVRDVAWARGPTKAPEHFIAVSAEGDLQIRKTDTGEEVRLIAQGLDVGNGPPRIAISSDRRYVYFDRMATEGACANETRAIDRIDLSSGERSTVLEGSDFALNPYGNQIAYVMSSQGCLSQDTLVIRNIEGSGEQRYRTEGEWTIAAPHWSPDGRLLVVNLQAGDRERVVQLDTVEPEGSVLSDASAFPEIPTPEYYSPAGFLTNDEFLGVGGGDDTVQSVTFNHRGGIERRFTTIPGVMSVVSTAPTTDGEHVLLLVSQESESGKPPLVGASLISVGALEPKHVADDVVSAAWLEGPLPEEPLDDGDEGRTGVAATRSP